MFSLSSSLNRFTSHVSTYNNIGKPAFKFIADSKVKKGGICTEIQQQ